MQWFYSNGEKQWGPVSQDELLELIRGRKLDGDSLVWQEGFGGEWKSLKDVQELASSLVTTTPAEVVVPSASPLQEPEDVGQVVSVDQPFPSSGEFTRRARESLSGNWGIAVGIYLVFIIITVVISYIPVPFIGMILMGPFLVGLSRFFLNVTRRQGLEIDQLFSGFSTFGGALGTYLLSSLFIFLWSLLLIIPGIIASFAYSQVYFLLVDHPELSPMDAIRSSKALMDGRKGDLFMLRLRLFGWVFVGLITLGIGFLWIIPYWMTADATFYKELRARQQR